MQRAAFHIVSFASLLLCLVAAVLWVRSVGHVEGGFWAGSSHDVTYYSWSGCLVIHGTIGDGPSRPENSGLQHWRRDNTDGLYSMANPPVMPGPGRSGFGLCTIRTVAPGWRHGGYPLFSVFAPYWFLTPLFGVLPVLWLRRWLTRSRRSCRRRGLCEACGYDLRASRDTCPECGTPIPADLVRKPLESGVSPPD